MSGTRSREDDLKNSIDEERRRKKAEEEAARNAVARKSERHGPDSEYKGPPDPAAEQKYEAESHRQYAEAQAKAEKERAAKEGLGRFFGAAGRVLAAGITGQPGWDDYNRSLKPQDLTRYRAAAGAEGAKAGAHLRAADDDSRLLGENGLPTPAGPGGSGGSAAAAVSPAPYITSAKQAAAWAAAEDYRYNQEASAYLGAEARKIEAMSFDLTSQGKQLARSIMNAKPEQQAARLAGWRDSIMRNPAYNPDAPGITAREREARIKVLDQVMMSFSAEVQRNSFEQQESQALADLGTRIQAVQAGVQNGEYKDKEHEAYANAYAALEGARAVLSPQQYGNVFNETYRTVTEGLFGNATDEFLQKQGGSPVYDMDAIAAKLTDIYGYGEEYALRALGSAGLDPELDKDAKEAVKLSSGELLGKAQKRIQDYNRGLLDTWEENYRAAIDGGIYETARAIAGQWKGVRRNLIDSGAISAEQARATDRYFTAKIGGSGGPGGSGGSGLPKTGDYVDKMRKYIQNSGDSQGMSPAAALEEYTQKIIAAAYASGDYDGHFASEESYRIFERQVKNDAAYELTRAWLADRNVKGTDRILDAIDKLDGAAETFTKENPEHADRLDEISGTFKEIFMDRVFRLDDNSNAEEINGLLESVTQQFTDGILAVSEIGKENAETLDPFHAVTIKELGGLDEKYRAMLRSTGSREKGAYDPDRLALNPLTDDMYGKFTGMLTRAVAGAFSVEPEAVSIVYNHEADRFEANVNGKGRHGINLDRRLRFQFAPDGSGQIVMLGEKGKEDEHPLIVDMDKQAGRDEPLPATLEGARARLDLTAPALHKLSTNQPLNDNDYKILIDAVAGGGLHPEKDRMITSILTAAVKAGRMSQKNTEYFASISRKQGAKK